MVNRKALATVEDILSDLLYKQHTMQWLTEVFL